LWRVQIHSKRKEQGLGAHSCDTRAVGEGGEVKKGKRGRRRLIQCRALNKVDGARQVRAHSLEENALTPGVRERVREREREQYFIG